MIQATLKDVFSLAKERRIVFIVSILSITCSFLVISLMIGVVNYEISSAHDGSLYNTFTIEYSEGITSDTLMDKYKSLMNMSIPRTFFAASFSYDKLVIVGWYGENDNRWFVQDEGRFITNSDIEVAGKVCVISEELYPELEFKEDIYTIPLGAINVSIVGVGALANASCLFSGVINIFEQYDKAEEQQSIVDMHATLDTSDNENIFGTVIIPISTFAEVGFDSNLIRVEYPISNKKELEKYHSILKNCFADAQIIDPVISEEFYASDMQKALFYSAGLVVVAFINIMSLYIYYLLTMRRTHTLYMVCGARKSTIISMICLEWLFVSLIGCVLYIIIQTMAMPILCAVYIEPVTAIGPNILMFLFIYLSSSSIMLRQIIRNTHICSEVI